MANNKNNGLNTLENENIVIPKDETIDIAVIGDIMCHNSQYIDAYDKTSETYDFSYVFDDAANFRLKESVTSLNNKNKEEKLLRYNNENFNFSSNAVDVGNAYHAALKAIDFEKIENS